MGSSLIRKSGFAAESGNRALFCQLKSRKEEGGSADGKFANQCVERLSYIFQCADGDKHAVTVISGGNALGIPDAKNTIQFDDFSAVKLKRPQPACSYPQAGWSGENIPMAYAEETAKRHKGS